MTFYWPLLFVYPKKATFPFANGAMEHTPLIPFAPLPTKFIFNNSRLHPQPINIYALIHIVVALQTEHFYVTFFCLVLYREIPMHTELCRVT